MIQRIYIDRSRIVTRERCPRRRFLEYHESGTGIVPKRTPLPLAVGGSVHEGLAVLLRESQDKLNAAPTDFVLDDTSIEERAVAAALKDFSQYQSKIAVDASEAVAMQPTAQAEAFAQQVMAQARELGMDTAAIGQLGSDPAVAQSEFDRYLWAEQSALVEGLVRAYSRRRLRPLLEQFEVLEVEREGEWKLGEWTRLNDPVAVLTNDKGLISYKEDVELWFMSRPDALLRERQTNELYLLSYKTTAQWDVRKARDSEHDMQGLSEGVEVERRLAHWWGLLNHPTTSPSARLESAPQAMTDFLKSCPAPPRIHAIRYEFLLKGERWKDRELSARLGIECRSQKSHLVYRYVATSTPKTGKNTDSFRVGDVCWAWEFTRPEDQQASKLYAGNWRPRAVWEDGSIRDWIDRLDRSEVLMSGEDSTIGLAPRQLGYRSDAQAMGVTEQHPLDAVFIPPVVVYRSDDQLRDWVEQVEHSEREVAGHVMEVMAATDGGEKRHLLNLYFPQNRHSCEYPSQCPFARDRVGVCWAGAEMQGDPLGVGAGEYVRRQPNHPVETQLIDIKK